MSKLIQMRGRIQTIETIRKVTDAMRIISMSAHSRLKTKQEPMNAYLNTLSILLAKVQQATPSWSNERLMSTGNHTNPLCIVIGSQKGLCGNFNTQVAKFFTRYLEQAAFTHFHCIPVGKKAVDYVRESHENNIVRTFSTLTTNNFLTIAQELSDFIMTSAIAYTHVIIFSNTFKSFFVQKPTITNLLPFDQKKNYRFSRTTNRRLSMG